MIIDLLRTFHISHYQKLEMCGDDYGRIFKINLNGEIKNNIISLVRLIKCD